MNIDPYNPDPHTVQKTDEAVKERFEEALAKHPELMAETAQALANYAESSGLSQSEALDEAIFALPRTFPRGLANLTDWIPRCQQGNIPHVPITGISAPINTDTLEAIYSGSQPPSPALDHLAQFIADAYSHGEMWRWDPCAPENLKMLAGLRRTDPKHQTVPLIPLGLDERLFSILWGDQAINTQVVSRPWIQPQMETGMPVEFRVFKSENGYAACSYYPQRPLPEKYLKDLENAVKLTQQLVQANPDLHHTFSCDWMLTPSGELLFLEGGPGHLPYGGAHPCCFGINKTTPGRALLQPEPGSMLHIPPGAEPIFDAYTAEKIDYQQACKLLGMPPKTAAAIFAVKGIIPREMAEKVITG